MFKNISLMKKIGLLISIFVISTTLLQLLSSSTMKEMKQNTTDMYENRVIPMQIFAKYRLNTRFIIAEMWQLFTPTDAATTSELNKDIDNRFKQGHELIQEYKKSKLTPEESKTINKINYEFSQFETSLKDAKELAALNKNDEAIRLYNSVVDMHVKNLGALGDQLMKLNVETSSELNEINIKYATSAIRNTRIIFIIVTGISIFLGIYITRMIVKPIKQLVIALRATQSGDLTQTVDYQSKDEIGVLATAYNDTTETLRELIGQVKETSEQVAAFSSELSASAEQTSEASEHIASVTLDVASGAEDQVNTVTETSNTVQSMVNQVQAIGNNSFKVNEVAKEAEELSIDGSKVIQKAVEQMNSIHNAISGLNNVINELGDRSEEIGGIISVITGIADQTNLLALNAAIEAARVGEQGKGFAVVAAEVRKLAEESAGSANKIAQLINAIQTEVKKATESMELTTNQVEVGTNNVNNAGSSFDKIHSSINEVSSQLNEVSSSVQELVAGTEQLGHSVGDINTTAQNTAEGTQNISAATEEQLATLQEITASSVALSKMAEELQEKTKIFIV